DNDYIIDDNLILKKGDYTASEVNGKIQIEDQNNNKFKSQSPELTPLENSFFELKEVTIGVNFHWEQNENQQFKGALKLIADNNQVCAVNLIEIEEYLKSVIASEMSSTSSPDLLKAHSVISRSWLLAQIVKTKS
ncbi:SpoIID/LytB domain-containing protein, partial [Dolichospermum sp. ST_sed4]|nr:SpoIID/LytB domain-containing protein [Dolichospermum sp. ST_sed4]